MLKTATHGTLHNDGRTPGPKTVAQRCDTNLEHMRPRLPWPNEVWRTSPFDCPYSTHRPLSSSFLGLPYRILNINHKEELLRGLWVAVREVLQPDAQPSSADVYDSASVCRYACRLFCKHAAVCVFACLRVTPSASMRSNMHVPKPYNPKP